MAVQPLVPAGGNAEQKIGRITAPVAGTRALTARGGLEEGQQRIERVVGGV